MTTACRPSEPSTTAIHWPGQSNDAGSAIGTSPRLRSASHCRKNRSGSESAGATGTRTAEQLLEAVAKIVGERHVPIVILLHSSHSSSDRGGQCARLPPATILGMSCTVLIVDDHEHSGEPLVCFSRPARRYRNDDQRRSLFASWSNHIANSVNCVPETSEERHQHDRRGRDVVPPPDPQDRHEQAEDEADEGHQRSRACRRTRAGGSRGSRTSPSSATRSP